MLNFFSTKKDNYDQDISYFKIVDQAFRTKLKPLFGLNDEGLLKMPIWVTDQHEHILKAKSTFIVNVFDFIKCNTHH